MYGVARNENVEISCEVDANPEPDAFKWSLNHSQEPFQEKALPIIDRKRGLSILVYTPRNDMDFGYVTCTATNRVGTQSTPCHYQIIPAGKVHTVILPFFSLLLRTRILPSPPPR